MPLPQLDIAQALFLLELIGVAAFAIAGALKAIEREMDIFGILVLAATTALGGGIIRDVLVQRFPVSLDRPYYFYLAIISGLMAVMARHPLRRYAYWLRIFDALGLAVFSVLGAQVGLQRELNYMAVLLLGLLTGVGGGVLRDLLAHDIPPLVLRQEVYALASLLGITAQWGMVQAGLPSSLAVITGVLVILAIRLAAIRRDWHLPRVK